MPFRSRVLPPPLRMPAPPLRIFPESKFLAKVPNGQLPASAVHVYIRKRPLFKYEIERGEFDVVRVPSPLRPLCVCVEGSRSR